MTAYLGINIGALTVKVVAFRGAATEPRVVPHQGRALAVVRDLLAADGFADADYFGVSGRLGHLSEVAAIQRAVGELPDRFDAVASLGGESFLSYLLAGGRIINVLSHDKCAAGSGEFLVQQIGRMGIGIDEAIRRSFAGRVVPLASRCSVHCKSDITHKLNRHEATPEDILHTLHDSMANKVVSLLEKGQRELRRVLLIGGVSGNAAMVAALRAKLPATEFVVLPESAWLEAWGTALLTRDAPCHRSPQFAGQAHLSRLPPLHQYRDRVQVIPAPPRPAPSAGPLVLGVDAGSTTTKAVLLDPATQAVVASHYARTNGDPVAATRHCLRTLVGEAGNRQVMLVATTGSARELIGAYLGTKHVYNEISAHAAGAHHYDDEVDTIFEIGGQDAKYIYLRNGVPMDYAMNNACSAGTGSFLEESAHGDLGLEVAAIAVPALAAPAPVQFKTTCAAFINSDIRIAQQEGHSRENIVAGLVYAIAANYLNRVKGPRHVGRKVFLQGGVALNRAIGNAFAHSVGRQMVIPPTPELLGALGVALLAQQRADGAAGAAIGLLTLAAPEMTMVGRFTCRACQLYCSIDRFEVAGRRFPFGGRCSLYENVWKRKSRQVPAADLVARRGELLFGRLPAAPAGGLRRIGIPKALTTHSLYPLYATFFSTLGMEVVLSGIDPLGELKTNAGFCFPAQLAHGAVLDLCQQGVKLVFLPHVSHLPQQHPAHGCFLCPISQASPYVLTKVFDDVRFLSPVLDFAKGYAANPALVEMAVKELGAPPERAKLAWSAAINAQTDVEHALREMGCSALAEALATGQPAVLLAGHSYNAFSPEASQAVGKKLASMGVVTIPADCLEPVGEGATAWHFANQILNAVAIAKQHPNLFLLCVSNFSCTIDAFTQSVIASQLEDKPYLILEIDAHTADAGVQTRLEAFLDIVRHYRAGQPAAAEPFTPCRLTRRGGVIRSDGAAVSITDPRVKIHFPSFSFFHSAAFAMAARWLGLHPGAVIPLDRTQLDRGLQHSSGRECLPLPIALGQLLHAHEHRQPGEIIGFAMVRGGAPCVVDCYMGYFERFIAEQRLPDLFLLNPNATNDYLGFDESTLLRHLMPAVLVADILVEIEQVLRVAGADGSVAQLHGEWQRLVRLATSHDGFQAALQGFIDRLAGLPRNADPADCPRVVVTGDFFTRFSPFFIEGVPELYAAQGIILKPVDLSELAFYNAYFGVAETAGGWGMKPGGLALAKACLRAFQPDGKQYLQQWLSFQAGRRSENHYRQLFQRTGLLVAGPNDASALFEHAAEHVSPKIFGELVPMVGKGVEAAAEGYDGIILIGPFNCLPYRISEAILKPHCIRQGMPLLTYESDGYAVAPSFLRQVDVHIQQVLQSAAAKHRRVRAPTGHGRGASPWNGWSVPDKPSA
ncbi:MAG: acyl-CoA dehydratase activase [Akkermansiaceae bacterium]|nr:acyl-CoA dehydratase activase [Akkermansiaceae bacterium]